MADGNSDSILPQSKPTREELVQIHALCTRFETQWGTPAHTPAETLIDGSGINNRSALVESILRSELELRGFATDLEDSGSTPTQSELLKEFLQRFPNDANAVRRAFVPVHVVETLDETPRTSASVANPGSLPISLGPYEVIELFAHGGMGIIYRARHTQLNRVVALKVIRSGLLASETEIARFRKESQTIAALDHPHIVPIFDVGEASGFQYFSMPLLPGESLADRIRERPLPADEAARLVSQVASAVHFAHQHGVIHRDLKPRNILIDATGNARVSDFGLAKQVADPALLLDGHAHKQSAREADLTMTGEVVGTPAYMAPEQAAGRPTSASDIYAIGAVLYALLTGRPPFQAATLLETLRQAQEKEPVELRRLNATVPRDLETIALKCLSKNPSSRYASADMVAADLERFRRGQSIMARPTSSIEHAARWVRRNPAIAGSMMAVFISLIAGLAVSAWFFSVARNREQLANRNFDVALSTVRKYLADVAVSPELKSQGLEHLRRELLENARDFYTQLERQPFDSAKLKEELNDAHFQLAKIHTELGELDEADRFYELAIEGWSALAEATKPKQQLEQVLLKLGSAYQQRAKSIKLRAIDAKWEEASRKAIEQYRLANELTPSTTASIRLASALAEFAIDFGFTDRKNEEAEAFDQVEQACVPLRASIAEHDAIDECVEAMHAFDHLALYKQQKGAFKEAEDWYLTLIAIGERLRQRAPENQQVLHQLGRAHKNLNLVYTKMQRFADGEAQTELASVILKKLTVDHPLVIEYLDDYASMLINRAAALMQRGKFLEAVPLFDEAVQSQTELVRRQPQIPKHHSLLGLVYSNHGFCLLQLGRLDEAETALKQALHFVDLADKMPSGDLTALWVRATSHNNLGTVYRDQGLFSEAKAAYQTAYTGYASLMDKNPNVVQYQLSGITCNINLAATNRRLFDTQTAHVAVDRAKTLLSQLPAAMQEAADVRSFKANALTAEAEIYMEENQLDKAASCCASSIEILSNLVATDANPTRFQLHYAVALADRSKIETRRQDFEVALQSIDSALAIYAKEIEAQPGNQLEVNQRLREMLCMARLDRARALFGLNRLSDARAECETALQLKSHLSMPLVQAFLGRVLIAIGNKDDAEKILSEIDPDARPSYERYFDQALAYGALSPDAPAQRYTQSVAAARELNPSRFEQDEKVLPIRQK